MVFSSHRFPNAVLKWDGSEVSVDDSEITISYDADANQTLVEFDYNNIIEGRHNLYSLVKITRYSRLILPVWNDDFDWNEVVIFCFRDRFYNGDSDNDGGQGSNSEMADYLEVIGVVIKNDYLEDLGVNTCG